MEKVCDKTSDCSDSSDEPASDCGEFSTWWQFSELCCRIVMRTAKPKHQRNLLGQSLLTDGTASREESYAESALSFSYFVLLTNVGYSGV